MTKTNWFGILTVVCILLAGIIHDNAPAHQAAGLVWALGIISVLFACTTFTCYLNGPSDRD